MAYYTAQAFAFVASSCLGEVVISLLTYLLSFLNLPESHLEHLVPLVDLLRVEKFCLGSSWAGHSECGWHSVGIFEAARIVGPDTFNSSSVRLVVIYPDARQSEVLTCLVELLGHVRIAIYLLRGPKRDSASVLHFELQVFQLVVSCLIVLLVSEYVCVSFQNLVQLWPH